MIVVDTNVVVRLLVRDDERQWRAAQSLLERSSVMVLASVLMECEWVLRKVYQLRRDQIHDGLAKLCGANGVAVESDAVLLKALDDYRAGWDFADAIHLRHAETLKADGFATFDVGLRRRSDRHQSGIPVIAP